MHYYEYRTVHNGAMIYEARFVNTVCMLTDVAEVPNPRSFQKGNDINHGLLIL